MFRVGAAENEPGIERKLCGRNFQIRPEMPAENAECVRAFFQLDFVRAEGPVVQIAAIRTGAEKFAVQRGFKPVVRRDMQHRFNIFFQREGVLEFHQPAAFLLFDAMDLLTVGNGNVRRSFPGIPDPRGLVLFNVVLKVDISVSCIRRSDAYPFDSVHILPQNQFSSRMT